MPNTSYRNVQILRTIILIAFISLSASGQSLPGINYSDLTRDTLVTVTTPADYAHVFAADTVDRFDATAAKNVYGIEWRRFFREWKRKFFQQARDEIRERIKALDGSNSETMTDAQRQARNAAVSSMKYNHTQRVTVGEARSGTVSRKP
jgi:hypothetical protein